MAATPRWVPWARASLLCALVGHLVANALLDERQYLEAGLEYGWAASAPLLVQSIVVLAIVASLGRLARRRAEAHPPGRLRLFVGFASSQLLVFLALETSERVAQDEPFVRGIFASGFSLELLFALASAFLLAALASLTVRIARSIRRALASARSADASSPPARSLTSRRVVALAVRVRAPPALDG